MRSAGLLFWSGVLTPAVAIGLFLLLGTGPDPVTSGVGLVVWCLAVPVLCVFLAALWLGFEWSAVAAGVLAAASGFVGLFTFLLWLAARSGALS
jgi:hypothetical protein